MRAVQILLVTAVCLTQTVARAQDESDDDPSHGLATEAIDSVTKVSEEEESEELETFSREYIGVLESSSGLGLYRGKYLAPLDVEDFLRTVGEVQLADEQAHNETLDTVLVVGGHVGLWGGLTMLIVGSSESSDALMYVGLGAMGGGLAMWVARSFVEDQVITAPQAREMAETYNVALRKKQNLTAEEAREAIERVEAKLEEKALIRNVRVVPLVAPNGARLVITGAF